MTLSIKQIWEARAQELGKPLIAEANQKNWPIGYVFTLNWAASPYQKPMVIDPDKTPEENEHLFYTEATNLFKQRATSALKILKRSDKSNSIRLSALLKRLEVEEPSSELLGQLSIYTPIINSNLEAVEAGKTTEQVLLAESEAVLKELDKRYYKVLHGGKAVLYSVDNDEWTTYDDLRTHYGHIKVQVFEPDAARTRTKNAFDAYRSYNNVHRYDEVVFNPRHNGHFTENGNGRFNLWQGIAVTPEPGDEDMMVWELLDKICDGNEGYFNYVQNWFAHLIQKPWELPGTAIGISGEQGLGKNALVETFGALLSTQRALDAMHRDGTASVGKVLSMGAFGYFVSYDEVFGNFNSLAANKLLLLLDEATWGGFHDQKARFKTAVTGRTIRINDKFMRHLDLTNYRRFILLSNDGHYVGVDPSDRRLLPLEFKTENRPSQEWFDTFYQARRDGKLLNNLLHRLQSIDLAAWEPMPALRALNITTGAALQQGSAPEYQKWFVDIAENGSMLIPPTKETTEDRDDCCGEFRSEDDLRRSYQHFSGSKDQKGWNSPSFVEARNKLLGEKIQRRHFNARPWGRDIPTQAELQARLSAQYTWNWLKFQPIVEEQPQVDDSITPGGKVVPIRDGAAKVLSFK